MKSKLKLEKKKHVDNKQKALWVNYQQGFALNYICIFYFSSVLLKYPNCVTRLYNRRGGML